MRFIEKKGKIAKNIDEAYTYVRRREEFSGTLVQMMDGGKGRRYAGRWNVKYDPDRLRPEPHVVVKTYTVYSYGDHFPMYVWDELAGAWYGNAEKYSRTTSKHMSKLYPGNVNCYLDTDELREISLVGVAGWVKAKMESAP